ncbi:MAG: hypothetical protein QOC77_3372 [Thermoleophilaceae bacterium]|nr:hypothetical protein [Thermoleophilaceae bacterium]
MRRAITVLAVVVLLAGPTALAYSSGGYFDPERLIAALVAWALLAVAAVVSPQPLPRSRSGRVALAGLVLLTAWTGASLAWAPQGAPAADAVQRLLLYAAAFASAAALLRHPLARRATEPALALGTLLVVGYGLLDRLLPGAFALRRSSVAGGRLEQPLTYWNAMGALAAIGALLCVRLAGDTGRPRWLRTSAAAGAVPLAVGVQLSYSRGALAALGIGLLALAVLALTRSQLRALAVGLLTGVPAALVANSLDGVRALAGTVSARESDGLTMLAVLAGLSAIAAAVTWLAARDERGAIALPRRVGIALVMGVVVVAGVGLALAARHQGQPSLAGANAARLESLESHRTKYWKVALEHGFAAHPLKGVGAGGFGVIWLRYRDVRDRVKVAHSLYLETLAELGAVGFLFLAMFLGGVATAAARARMPGASAALIVWATHSALDWDWEMPALALVALALAGLVVAAAEDEAAPA